MAKIDVKKEWDEGIRLGRQRGKFRSGASNEPNIHKWSYFGKAVVTGWFGKKAFKKADYAPKSWDQRSIAKVSYMKNSYQGQWAVHGRYLARQGAQLEDRPGLGFDSNDEDLNIAKTLKGWQKDGDPRFWKIIISPEMAHRLNLKAHVRAVMAHVEKDLGGKLEWVAIDHYNTDNFHAHIVLRGVDEVGKELRINKEYFTQGFRQRSIQEATRVLGLRLEGDVLSQRNEVIRAMHITEMDREIERNLTKDNFINLKLPQSSFMYAKELQLKSRLMFLEEIGVAQKHTSVSWHVDRGFIDYLKFLQTQQDIVKAKNRHIKDILDPRLPMVFNKLENVGDSIMGMVIGMGLSESPGEPRYMLIEGIDNKIHYILTPEGVTKKRDGGDLRNGDTVYLERREIKKQVKDQEPKKIRYIFAESFSDFDSFINNERLGEIDICILNVLQGTRRLPKADPFDGEVRKEIFDLMKRRIQVLQREDILREDLSINDHKLGWVLNNNVKITKGRGLGLTPPWGENT